MNTITTQHIADLKTNKNNILVITASRTGWKASVTDALADGQIVVTLGAWGPEDSDGLCERIKTPITGALVAAATQPNHSLINTIAMAAEIAWTQWDRGNVALAEELAEDPTSITKYVI
jgi:hypothetical protein